MPTTPGRLLSLLSPLQARRDWPGPLLAERLDVSVPTVRRDVDRLRAQVDSVRVTAVARPSSGPRVATTVLQALTTAVAAREVLRVDLAPALPTTLPDADRPPPRRVEPHHLVTWSGRWYLVAWDLDRADWRTFRVDRLTPRTPSGPRFLPRDLPGGDVAAFITSRSQGEGAWRCRGEVVLDLPAEVVALGRFDADLEVVGPVALQDAFAQLGLRFTAAGRP